MIEVWAKRMYHPTDTWKLARSEADIKRSAEQYGATLEDRAMFEAKMVTKMMFHAQVRKDGEIIAELP